MANSSTTLFMLLLIVASGSMVLASKGAILDGSCLTNLGICGKNCDQTCCEKNCFDDFRDRHPSPVCEMLPGSALRLCNCYHDC
ncbi:hypothetical protein P3S68_022117 [Capsicum galapagoense]